MSTPLQAVVVGAGPAGLMAAEKLAEAGLEVAVFDAMPSVGRKFLRAGIGGLNLTHSEEPLQFRQRYGEQSARIATWLQAFDGDALRHWCGELGVDTFVGSSGRVFPSHKKAAPLLRRWLQRLRRQGVSLHSRHHWQGWSEAGELMIAGPSGVQLWQPAITVFALGGASWSKLGSDGAWQALFLQRGIKCSDFQPSNCGFCYQWGERFVAAHAGTALKNIALQLQGEDGGLWRRKGDAMLSHYGVEGSLVYAASARIRDDINAHGQCTVHWDLLPDLSIAALRKALAGRRAKDSLANVLRKQLGLSGGKLALLKALSNRAQMADLQQLPELLKALPQRFTQARPLDEAISTAGGVSFDELNDGLMLKRLPGSFCVGEMLDWEAPTGGYLLTACFASAVVAAQAAVDYLSEQSHH